MKRLFTILGLLAVTAFVTGAHAEVARKFLNTGLAHKFEVKNLAGKVEITNTDASTLRIRAYMNCTATTLASSAFNPNGFKWCHETAPTVEVPVNADGTFKFESLKDEYKGLGRIEFDIRLSVLENRNSIATEIVLAKKDKVLVTGGSMPLDSTPIESKLIDGRVMKVQFSGYELVK
jgi:hypothetical protein